MDALPVAPPGATPAAAVLEAVRPRLGGAGVLLLDGRSGSGKTTLAAWLAARLGARVLAVEDLYPGWDGLEAAAALLAARILPALVRGEAASWPTWDWAADRPGPVASLRPGGRIVVEGCGALTRGSRALADAAVLLDVDDAVRRQRILRRDPPEAMPGHRRWATQERRTRVKDPQARLADLVLRGGVALPGQRITSASALA